MGGIPLVGLAIAGANASFFAGLVRLSRGPAEGRLAGAALRSSLGIVCVAATLLLGQPRPDTARQDAPTASADAEPSGTRPAGSFRVALIQPAVMKQAGVSDYEAAFRRIASLSDQALAAGPDLVAWHETAVVPPVE